MSFGRLTKLKLSFRKGHRHLMIENRFTVVPQRIMIVSDCYLIYVQCINYDFGVSTNRVFILALDFVIHLRLAFATIMMFIR